MAEYLPRFQRIIVNYWIKPILEIDMHGESFKIQAYEKIRIFGSKISGPFLQRQPLNLYKCARNAAILLELPWTRRCITSNYWTRLSMI